MQVDLCIISRDVYFLRQQAKQNIKKYVDERLPEEYEKCLVGLTAILREAWITSQQTEDTVVDDAIRFVSQKSKEKVKSSSNSNQNDKESNEPDYYEDQDQLEEEQEEPTVEMPTKTINQVF